MDDFYILNAANTVHYDKWHNVWLAWEEREVFAHPEYVKLFIRDCDCAICAVQESPTGLILLPLILRPLSTEAWAGGDNIYYDAITPYGFGGPYISGSCDIEGFWHEFHRWAYRKRVVSSFFRLSPFATEIKNFVTSVEITGDIVIRSLGEGKETVWQDYDRKVRSNVKRALRENLQVEIDTTGEKLSEFTSIYYQTMQRRNALETYYFQESCFNRLVNNLPGQFAFFHAAHRGSIISSLLVLLSQKHMYAFLLGTNTEALQLYPNEILHHTAITWGIDQGKQSYVLGGGYEKGDGIFRFKKYFAPNGVVPFSVGKQIHDNAAYQHMCEKRKRYEVDNRGDGHGTGTYFPAYRTKWD